MCIVILFLRGYFIVSPLPWTDTKSKIEKKIGNKNANSCACIIRDILWHNFFVPQYFILFFYVTYVSMWCSSLNIFYHFNLITICIRFRMTQQFIRSLCRGHCLEMYLLRNKWLIMHENIWLYIAPIRRFSDLTTDWTFRQG